MKIFHASFGGPRNPALVLVHGFPTTSIDYAALIDALKAEFYICMLDFPGFGFSDKAADGCRYSLKDDAGRLRYTRSWKV